MSEAGQGGRRRHVPGLGSLGHGRARRFADFFLRSLRFFAANSQGLLATKKRRKRRERPRVFVSDGAAADGLTMRPPPSRLNCSRDYVGGACSESAGSPAEAGLD